MKGLVKLVSTSVLQMQDKLPHLKLSSGDDASNTSQISSFGDETWSEDPHTDYETTGEMLQFYMQLMDAKDWAMFMAGFSIGSVVEVSATLEHDSECLT